MCQIFNASRFSFNTASRFLSRAHFVLVILEDRKMDIELRVAAERVELPGFVEFELVTPCRLSAKYYVNNCPGKPQLEAWVSDTAKAFLKDYPAFAYIKKL